MWPFKKNKKTAVDNSSVSDYSSTEQQDQTMTDVSEQKTEPKPTEPKPKPKPKAKSATKAKPKVAKKKTATTTKKATTKKVVKNKIYIGDKKKIITLRLSHDLLSKIKNHASKNKKMTLSQLTRHLYNQELIKLENLIAKPELNLKTE